MINAVQRYMESKKALQQIDVTALSEVERAELFDLWKEYNDYVERFCKNIFSFPDFIAQTTGKSYPTVANSTQSTVVEVQDNTKKLT